jgi:hypothetical protein
MKMEKSVGVITMYTEFADAFTHDDKELLRRTALFIGPTLGDMLNLHPQPASYSKRWSLTAGENSDDSDRDG